MGLAGLPVARPKKDAPPASRRINRDYSASVALWPFKYRSAIASYVAASSSDALAMPSSHQSGYTLVVLCLTAQFLFVHSRYNDSNGDWWR